MGQLKDIKSKDNNDKEFNSNYDKQIKLNIENKKIKEQQFPDSLKYNPNYNSIFKKIHSFKIGYDQKGNLGKLVKPINQIDKKIKLYKKPSNKLKDSNKLFKTNIKINVGDDKNNNINKKEFFLNLPPITFRNINKKLENDNIKNIKYNTIETQINSFNNHPFFNKLNSRNENSESKNNYRISGNSQSNRTISINNAIDFKKISSRNDKYLINAYSLDVPSFEKYSPKYNYIDKNVKNIKFTPFGSNKNDKKFLLKKMLSSYNVPTEYQFIDNEKLTKDKDLITKQLILKYNIYP